MPTANDDKLKRLRNKLGNTSADLLTAQRELAATQAAVDHDLADAEIQERQADKSLSKKATSLKDRIADLTTNRDALQSAVQRIEELIQATADEAKFERITKLRAAVDPKLAKWKASITQLAAASNELLSACEQSDAYADIGFRQGLGQFLFSPSDWRDQGKDYELRCNMGQLFGLSAELTRHYQYKYLEANK